MLLTQRSNTEFDNLLIKAASNLDIPDHLYDDATLKYEDVGDWLGAEDSELLRYSPEIYVQGSFRLGTMVRPISEKDEFDIDLVCHLAINKEQTTQKELKEMVGKRLSKREDLENILKPCRRCWTLEYPQESRQARFHMDVLPAIPNTERLPTGILLTDTDLKLWQKSNPKAYGDWFYDRMKIIFQEQRVNFAASIHANVEDVPAWQVKTPLQTAIQILKRHRDIHFQSLQGIKPVSIIITTLAARGYNNEHSVFNALTNILNRIESNWGKLGFVEYRNGRWWVANPVDDGENFADKWNEYPERRQAFIAWLRKVNSDLRVANAKTSLNESVETLAPVLGRPTMLQAANDLGLTMPSALPISARSPVKVPTLGDAGHCLRPHWPEQLAYKASIAGSVHNKQYARKKLWDLTDRPVPKKVWLRFLAKTNVPAPYDVHWQVVNTGPEAFSAHSLRGDFYESEKGITGIRWESTLYAGTHWVEAFIIKNGICLARSGKKYVYIR